MKRRREIVELLKLEDKTLSDIAFEFKTAPKEILTDLEHIRKSLKKKFVVKPAYCTSCGFLFKEREKLSRPSRCPMCKSERITAQRFYVQG